MRCIDIVKLAGERIHNTLKGCTHHATKYEEIDFPAVYQANQPPNRAVHVAPIGILEIIGLLQNDDES